MPTSLIHYLEVVIFKSFAYNLLKIIETTLISQPFPAMRYAWVSLIPLIFISSCKNPINLKHSFGVSFLRLLKGSSLFILLLLFTIGICAGSDINEGDVP